MPDDQYKVKVTSEGDDSGAKKVEAGLKAVGQEAKRAGELYQDAAGKWRNATGQFATNAEIAAAGINKSGKAATTAFSGLPSVFGTVSASATAMWASITGGITVAIGLITSLVKTVSSASVSEDLEASFTTLLGSRPAAKSRMEDLKGFADKTPFELPEVAQASKVLQNLTDGALATGKGLTMVGDVASGTDTAFSEIAVTVGRFYQALQSGAPAGEAAARLTELTGVNLRQMKSWEEAERAFSKYAGEMERRSKTFSGKSSTFGDALGGVGREIGKPLLDIFKPLLDIGTAVLGIFGKALEKINEIRSKGWTMVFGGGLIRGAGKGSAPDAEEDKAATSATKLSTASVSATAAAKELREEIEAIIDPLDQMAAAAERASKRVEALEKAKLSSGLKEVDLGEANGSLTPKEAALKKSALNAAAGLSENDRQTAAAKAELERSQKAADDLRPKTDPLKKAIGLAPLSEKAKALLELQDELDARVEDAKAKLETLSVERTNVELTRDAANLKAHSDEEKKADKADENVAKKKEELELEARLSEVKASGNTEEEKKLKWLQDYKAALASTKDEALARRVANARSVDDQKTPEWKTPQVNMSNMAKMGMAAGETSMAATIGAMLSQQLAEQRKVNEATVKSEGHLKIIKDKVGGKSKYG